MLKSEGGVIFIGEKGILMNDTYGSNPTIWPEGLRSDADRVAKTYPHRVEPRAQLGEGDPRPGQGQLSTEYASQLTETMLLGIAALRAGQGRRILYDGEKMQVTNVPNANQYLTREYRAGWAI